MGGRRFVLLAVSALLVPALLVVGPAEAQSERPTGCHATHLPSYRQYGDPNVQRAWDAWSRESRGVCRADKPAVSQAPAGCRHVVELGTPEHGTTGWLCWYGSLGTAATVVRPGGTDLRDLVQFALKIPQVRDQVGSGAVLVLFIIGGERTFVTIDGGRVAAVGGDDVRPAGCYDTYLPAYREYADAAVKKTWDEYSAATKGACRFDRPASPQGDDCRYTVQLGATSWICWWGGGMRTQSVADGKPDYTVRTSPAAFRSVANAEDKVETLKRLLARGELTVSAASPAKQAALKAALAAGKGSLGAKAYGGTLCAGAKATYCKAGTVYNAHGSRIGALSPKHDAYSKSPPSGIFFKRTPGVLAQNPGLVYDTVTKSPYGVGPHNIFKINPGLIGPNDILRQNPGLLGPADIGLLNPNLHGPREFAYAMGIGAHSNTAKYLQSQGLIHDPAIDQENRWGAKR